MRVSIFVSVVAAAMFAAAGAWAEDVGHCTAGEKPVFSCQIKGKTKVVSICASEDVGSDSGYIQYRFGVPGKIEMAFPANKASSARAFTMATHTRPGASYSSMSFKNKGVKYVVYDEYNSDSGQDEFASGVKVILPDGREVDLPCADIARNMWKVEEIVPLAEE